MSKRTVKSAAWQEARAARAARRASDPRVQNHAEGHELRRQEERRARALAEHASAEPSKKVSRAPRRSAPVTTSRGTK